VKNTSNYGTEIEAWALNGPEELLKENIIPKLLYQPVINIQYFCFTCFTSDDIGTTTNSNVHITQ
jgi:hypothetical protein